MVYCGQTVGWIKMKLDRQVGLGLGHTVLDGVPAPPPPKGQSPQFSTHICCGQMAAWIKMPLGMQIGLSPGHFVLDGDPVPFPQKGAEPPSQFSAHFYCGHWPNGCMHQNATWYRARPRPRRLCVRRGRSSPLKGHSPPVFDSCLLWRSGWMYEDTTGTEVDLGL